MTKFRLSSSIMVLLIFFAPFFAFADNITLAPVAEGTVTKMDSGTACYVIPGSSNSSCASLEFVGITSATTSDIKVFQQKGSYWKPEPMRQGVVEFEISGLSGLTPGTFTAELLLTIDDALQATTYTNTILCVDLNNDTENGLIENNDFTRIIWLPYEIKNHVVGDFFNYTETLPMTGTVLSIDVTSSVEDDLLHINENSYAGFGFFWKYLNISCGHFGCFGNTPYISFAKSSDGGNYLGPVLRITNNEPTAITISSFDAKLKATKILITWETGSEIDNLGFNILRSESESGPYTKINKKLIKSKGSSTKGASYKLKDKNIEAGKTYWYKLEDIDSNIGPAQHDAVKVEVTTKKIKAKK